MTLYITPDYLAKSGSEHSHQRALFAWNAQAHRHGIWFADHAEAYGDRAWRDVWEIRCEGEPRLKWLHAVHNQGHGDAIRGAKAKAEGVKAGVADLFLPVPGVVIEGGFFVKQYHGLYIELKRLDKSKTSSEQLEFKRDVEDRDYRHVIAKGWREARSALLTYLGLTGSPEAP